MMKPLADMDKQAVTSSRSLHMLLVGEFGAFRKRFPPVGQASDWMSDLARRLPGLGFDGWLYWTYDSDEQESVWNAMSENGVIFRALSTVASSQD